MQIKAETPDAYVEQLPLERQAVITKLRAVIKENLPVGFEETTGSGMISYVVPYSIYPAGYHCKPKQPLPFLGLASQKHFVAVYHMGIYADEALLKWFVDAYAQSCDTKLDMGKSCIRFNKMDQIPYGLIGELCTKMTPDQWIMRYKSMLK